MAEGGTQEEKFHTPKETNEEITNTPTPRETITLTKQRIGTATEAFLELRVGSEMHKKRLENLKYKDSSNDQAAPTRFQRSTESQEAHDRAQQVDIRSIRQGTVIESIMGAFRPWGEVEHVRLWQTGPGRENGRIAATIFFTTAEPVQTMENEQHTIVFIGQDTGRITRLSNKDIVYPKESDIKLSSIPKGIAPIELKCLNEQNGGCSFTIPTDIRTGRRWRETFFSFTNKDVYETFTSKDVQIGDSVMRWVAVDKKLCHQCGAEGHLVAECPTMDKLRQRFNRPQPTIQQGKIQRRSAKCNTS
ncbi:hypothetical protein EDD11_002394 [Mortierella claussenii]|nr:hypothetical protein EDD11_002394 [Mortierella claussenii]